MIGDSGSRSQAFPTADRSNASNPTDLEAGEAGSTNESSSTAINEAQPEDETNPAVFGVNVRNILSRTFPFLDTRVNIATSVDGLAADGTITGAEASALSSRLKQVLPFIILLLFKVFLDHFLDLLIICFAVYCLRKMQILLDEQIALKSRCNIRIIAIVLLIGMGTLFQVTMEMYVLTGQLIWYRLAFLPILESSPSSSLPAAATTETLQPISTTDGPNSKLPTFYSSFLSTLVLVTVCDICISVITCMLKAIACILIQSPYRFKKSLDISSFEMPMIPSSSSSVAPDIERGSATMRSSNASTTNSSLESSSMSGMIIDLVRRRGGGDHSHGNQQHQAVHSANTTPGSGTSSDSSTQQQESSRCTYTLSAILELSLLILEHRFLFLLRTNTAIDAVGLVYRAIVPAPIWLAYYFSGTIAHQHLPLPCLFYKAYLAIGVGGKFFSPCYFIFKVFQISNRIRDALDVVKIFFQGSLVMLSITH
jgi:hypothetical protein